MPYARLSNTSTLDNGTQSPQINDGSKIVLTFPANLFERLLK
jgi:hypothetical protein